MNNVLHPDALPRASGEGHEALFPRPKTLGFQPAVWIERVGIGEGLRVPMHAPGAHAYDGLIKVVRAGLEWDWGRDGERTPLGMKCPLNVAPVLGVTRGSRPGTP